MEKEIVEFSIVHDRISFNTVRGHRLLMKAVSRNEISDIEHFLYHVLSIGKNELENWFLTSYENWHKCHTIKRT